MLFTAQYSLFVQHFAELQEKDNLLWLILLRLAGLLLLFIRFFSFYHVKITVIVLRTKTISITMTKQLLQKKLMGAPADVIADTIGIFACELISLFSRLLRYTGKSKVCIVLSQ